MKLCGSLHPNQPGVSCDKEAPCWAYHANAIVKVVWDGIPQPPVETSPKSGRSMKAQLAMMASRAR